MPQKRSPPEPGHAGTWPSALLSAAWSKHTTTEIPLHLENYSILEVSDNGPSSPPLSPAKQETQLIPQPRKLTMDFKHSRVRCLFIDITGC